MTKIQLVNVVKRNLFYVVSKFTTYIAPFEIRTCRVQMNLRYTTMHQSSVSKILDRFYHFITNFATYKIPNYIPNQLNGVKKNTTVNLKAIHPSLSPSLLYTFQIFLKSYGPSFLTNLCRSISKFQVGF